jgi:hypothetical protein
MPTLKDQLIKLGSEQPELRKHLRPVLNRIASSFDPSQPPPSDPGREYFEDLKEYLEPYVEDHFKKVDSIWSSKYSDPVEVVADSVQIVGKTKSRTNHSPGLGSRRKKELISKTLKIKVGNGEFNLEKMRGRDIEFEYTEKTPKDIVDDLKHDAASVFLR